MACSAGSDGAPDASESNGPGGVPLFSSDGSGGAPPSSGSSMPVGTGGSAQGGSAPVATTLGGSGGSTLGAQGGASPLPSGGAPNGGAPNGGSPPANGGLAGQMAVGGSGGSTGVAPTGGASAAFACPDGVVFGNPLQGMGAVQSVSAPQGSFFAFIEGPVWIGSVNRLFFSDNASGPERIWQLEPPFTTPSVFMPSSGSNGLAVDNQDQLLLADQRDDRITRVDSTTAQIIEEVVPSGDYNPNDLILRSDDNLYFTDPNGAGRGLWRASPSGELSGPFTQSNAANAPNAPNGVVLSPDENTLYVGDVQQNFVATFALLPDGAIDTASGSVFVRTQGSVVDGMAVDCAGNLYVGTGSGVEVYAPDASFIGTVPTGEASNVTFGGADRRTLFVTSRAELDFVTLAVPGLPD